MNETILGIDIGATNIHFGAVRGDQIIKDWSLPTSADAPKEQIIAEIIQGVEKFENLNFSGIGVGVPGLVDEEQGIIYDLWNIPSWKEVFLKKHLEAHFQKPVRITNDANTFALGEKYFGKGKPYANMVGICLGSGFGTGIIIDHKLYSGTLSSAGELADIPYLDKTIEDYCSGKFFRNEYRMEGFEVYQLAKQNDAGALAIFREYGMHLGKAIKIIFSVLSPQAVFLGGSISKSYSFFETGLQEQIDLFPFKRVTNKLVIEPSETENISILGAAALIKSENKVSQANLTS
ncbi:MAG TPA: ROK family protein [Salinimicrobium sp.]|nr:ROK family protein [Salinimicrobium sp.]